MPALPHSFKTLRREWRSGELRLIAAALIVAVAAVTAVTLFTDRVRQAMVLRAAASVTQSVALGFGIMAILLLTVAAISWPTGRRACPRCA